MNVTEREPLVARSRTGDDDAQNDTTTTRASSSALDAAVLGPRAFVSARTGRRVLNVASALVSAALVAYAWTSNLLRGGYRGITVRQYGGGLGSLKWDPTNGFRTHPGAGKSRDKGSGALLQRTIERYYPSRLTPGSAPFEILFTSTDCPHTPCSAHGYAKDHCDFEKWDTIYAFGSSPVNKATLPTMHSATLLVLIDCMDIDKTLGPSPTLDVTPDMEPTCEFLEMASTKDDMSKCDRSAGSSAASLDCRYYGLFNIDAMENKSDYEWDNLIDKAIWRGSDYVFLSGQWPNSKPEGGSFFHEIASSADREGKMKSLIAGNRIGPRMKAVLMSKLNSSLIDAKFFNWGGGHAAGPLDLDTREHIEEDTFGKYRYQLDLGGGGGTTWSGVIPKLAMPGVLFHHVTSMKDSYFDLLKPYEHYYPLKEDFSNFEELVQEVRDDPEKAKRISAAATAWVKEFRKVGSLLKHNYDTLAVPLARSLDPTRQLEPIAFHVAHPNL